MLQDDLSRPHWSALAEGSLVIQHCPDCGLHQWYPRDWCLACDGSNIGWVAVSGRGELVTWTVAPSSGSSGSAVAVVLLEEGVQVFGALIVREGQRLRARAPVTFSPSNEQQPHIQWKVDS